MQNPHFPRFFNDAKDDKVVADRISAISHASEDGITAKFMCGGKFLKVCIAPFNTVREFCRSLWIRQLVGNVIKSALADGEMTTLYMKRRPHLRKCRLRVKSLSCIDFRL